MGFYGDIKNTARTQFYFDRIYPNRKAMEANAEKDNVFAGRFVLVEYEQNVSADSFQNYYMYKGSLYTDLNFVEVTNVKNTTDKILAIAGPIDSAYVRADSMEDGSVFCVPAGHHIQVGVNTDQYIRFTDSNGSSRPSTQAEYEEFYRNNSNAVAPLVFKIGSGGGAAYYTNSPIYSGLIAKIEAGHDYSYTAGIEFYQAIITTNAQGQATLSWKQISLDDDVFTRNFNIDKIYGGKRSYDSTVWQKVYEGNKERYIMVADLNTITPSFTFTPDAPAVTPIPIHYDAMNTNTNYNVHMQTPWGIRVRGADGKMILPLINSSGGITNGELGNSIFATEAHGINYPSDFRTEWKGDFYDITTNSASSKYYSPVSGKWNAKAGNVSAAVDAAVYVNRQGFSPEVIYKSKDVLNKDTPAFNPNANVTPYDYVGLEPTGYSGRVYNDHEHNEGLTPQVDTQELIIMLPSIGDAISDMWDIVYGGTSTNNDIGTTYHRNMDIGWEYANGVVARHGLRAVVDSNGRFQTQAVDTLAGCINSVHDLMGMIIVNDADTIDVSKLEDSYIYLFSDGTYRRKDVKYDYSPATYTYVPITLDVTSYIPGDYYTKSGNDYIVCNDSAFSASKSYYYKKVNLPETYDAIPLSPVPEYALYYKTPEENYRIVENVAENIPYWRQTGLSDEVTVTAFYDKYCFYWGTADGFNLDTADRATEGRGYYTPANITTVNLSLREQWKYDESRGEYIVGTEQDGSNNYEKLKYFYVPGVFYELVDSNGTQTLRLLDKKASEVDYDKTYYIIYGHLKEGDGAGNWVQNPDGSFTNSSGVTNLQITGWYQVTLMKLTPNKYYYAAETTKYIPDGDDYEFEGEKPENDNNNATEEDDENTYVTKYAYVTDALLKEFYEKEFTYDENTAEFKNIVTIDWDNAGVFYKPGMFYYQTPDGSWAKDTNENMTEGRVYYTGVSMTEVDGMTFYVPNKYYIVDDVTGNFIIDKRPEFTPGETYYKFLSKLYVLSDSRGRITPGSEWNMGVVQVPATVELATRVERIGTTELEGFARHLNTIHGLLLQANRMLAVDNYQTRDKHTVQGCINAMNDILDKFDEIHPNNFAIVDNYGRINDAHWDTLQKTSSTKTKTVTDEKILSEGVGEDKFAEANSVSAMRGQWLTVQLDSNPSNPIFRIHHNFQKVKDTTSTSNVNSNGDTIALYTPIVDEMGHVVGKDTKTVTLPYGFKTIASNGSSTAVTELTTSTTNIVADNTQDTFTINMGNKWLRTAANGTNDSMTFAHALSPISSQANTKYGLESNQTVNLLDGDNTFEVPVFQFDEAGHIIFAETHTVTIPEVFEKISVVGSSTNTSDTSSSSGTITADSLSDTLNFASGNQWLQLSHDATTDTVTFKHYVKKFTESTDSTDLDNSATFTVQELAWDNAGHLTGSTKRTYTLQDGYKNVSIANSGSNTSTAAAPGTSTGTLVAANRVDTVAMDTGNRWITLTPDATNKKVTFSHANAGTATTSKGDTAAQTPKFGKTFKVLSAGIDAAGHVSSLADHTVTIPAPSLSDTTTGNVVTGLSLVAEDGAFTLTKANVGTLALTGYTAPTSNATGTIAATDTISGAFKKVQSYLGSLTDRINGLDVSDSAVDGEFVSSVSQSDGKITVNRVALAPSITIGAGTSSAAPTVNVTVNGKSGTAQSITIASTSKYGVTKLTNSTSSTSTTTAATPSSVKSAYDLADSAKTVADAAVVANNAITGATKCKITYDAKGLVTGGADLVASDIPDLSATYITKTATAEYDLTKVETYTTDVANKTKLTYEELAKKVAILEARLAALTEA